MTWNRPWIKLWVDLLDDPKIVTLTESQRWVWVALLLMTTRSPEPGKLLDKAGRPMTTKLMWAFSRPNDLTLPDFEEAIDLFVAQDMATWQGDVLVITNWHRRQDVEGSAERMRRLRDRRRAGDGNRDDVTPPTVTPGVTVTPHQPRLSDDVTGPSVTDCDEVTPEVTGDVTPLGTGETAEKQIPEQPTTVPSLESDDVTENTVTSSLRASEGERGGANAPPEDKRLEEGEGEEERAGSGAEAPSRPTHSLSTTPSSQQVKDVLTTIETIWAQPIVHRSKEAKEIKAALSSGYSQEQIVACFRAGQESARWKGQWLPMAYLVEDLGEFVKTGQVKKWGLSGKGSEAADGQEDGSEQGSSRQKRF